MVAADLELSQILDALEAGLLDLGRERDELRRKLTREAPKKKAGPAAKKAAKKAPKKPGKKTVRKAAKKAAPKPAPAAKPEPKTPAKPRQALGKSLLQLRARPAAPTAATPQSD
jgi:hypothetical protein